MKGNSPLENVAQKIEKSISGAIKIDEKEVFDHLDSLVRQSVEETINSLLDAEADAICNANRYQRSPDRLDTRAGSFGGKVSQSMANRIAADTIAFSQLIFRRQSIAPGKTIGKDILP